MCATVKSLEKSFGLKLAYVEHKHRKLVRQQKKNLNLNMSEGALWWSRGHHDSNCLVRVRMILVLLDSS